MDDPSESEAYKRAKRNWENTRSEEDPTKTNKEYFDEWERKFREEALNNVMMKQKKEQQEKRKIIYNCVDCGERLTEADRFSHNLRKHLSGRKVEKNHLKSIDKELAKAIPAILFWGFWLLIIWWFLSDNSIEPDLDAYDPGDYMEICPSGPC